MGDVVMGYEKTAGLVESTETLYVDVPEDVEMPRSVVVRKRGMTRIYYRPRKTWVVDVAEVPEDHSFDVLALSCGHTCVRDAFHIGRFCRECGAQMVAE